MKASCYNPLQSSNSRWSSICTSEARIQKQKLLWQSIDLTSKRSSLPLDMNWAALKSKNPYASIKLKLPPTLTEHGRNPYVSWHTCALLLPIWNSFCAINPLEAISSNDGVYESITKILLLSDSMDCSANAAFWPKMVPLISSGWSWAWASMLNPG